MRGRPGASWSASPCGAVARQRMGGTGVAAQEEDLLLVSAIHDALTGWELGERRAKAANPYVTKNKRAAVILASSISLWQLAQLALQNLDLTICAIWYISVPSRG